MLYLLLTTQYSLLNSKMMKKSLQLLSILIALAIVSCNKPAEQPAQEPAGPQVVGQEVSYTADTTTMNGYIARDANKQGKRPGVLVIHEWWGHNAYVRKRADMLAELGYTALAVDMYGDGKQAAHPEDAGKFAMSVMGNMDVATARFNKALETLKADTTVNPEQIAVIGYCFGGSVALTMANAGMDLDAVAAFQSGLQLPVMPAGPGTIKAKVLVCNGAADPFIPTEQTEAFNQTMTAAQADTSTWATKGPSTHLPAPMPTRWAKNSACRSPTKPRPIPLLGKNCKPFWCGLFNKSPSRIQRKVFGMSPVSHRLWVFHHLVVFVIFK